MSQPSAFSRFGEHHTIETPEQTRLEFAIAGIGSRFLALALDLLIQTGAAIVLGLATLTAVALVPATGAHTGMWIAAIALLLFFVVHYGYFIGFEILWSGQTPGKRSVGIRVVKDSGRPLTAAETVARNLMRIVDELPAFYSVAVVTALLNSQNKRLGDFVAGSLVIREGSLAEMRPVWSTPQAEPAPPIVGAEKLSAEDLALIDTFLARRWELPAEVRARMAAGILERVQAKLPEMQETGLSGEALLERLAHERRVAGGYQ
jgi:uncharacterized RDD family membrane protein YckC